MKTEHNGIKYMFFWDGIFSNWYPSEFRVAGYNYNCAEQYLMHQKALLFKDFVTANKIMKSKYPDEQKQLGRNVENYVDAEWDKVRYNIAKIGLREKFLQNPNLLSYLKLHEGFQIVEASPYDRIWGIGYGETDAIANIDNWGENLLGKILTELIVEL